MQPTPRLKERRFPLHFHISVLFSLLLLSSGAVLGVFNYQQTSNIILSSSDQLFSQMRKEVQADLRNTYQPIQFMINLLARNEQVNGRDRHERMIMLPICIRPAKPSTQPRKTRTWCALKFKWTPVLAF